MPKGKGLPNGGKGLSGLRSVRAGAGDEKGEGQVFEGCWTC